MDARSEILQRIKEQEKNKKNTFPEPNWGKDVMVHVNDDLTSTFMSELKAIDGLAWKANSEEELRAKVAAFLRKNSINKVPTTSSKIKQILGGNLSYITTDIEDDLDCLVTDCEVLVAQTGSVFLSTKLKGGRKSWAYPPIHVVIAFDNQVVPTIKEALVYLGEKYGETIPSQITMVSGSSRTADIEKTLVKGVHGPVKLAVFILNKEIN